MKAADDLALALVAAGATVHFPSLIVHRKGAFAGKAILGYKRAATYSLLVRDRLAPKDAVSHRDFPTKGPATSNHGSGGVVVKDIEIDGRAGPYFRFANGWNVIAYEASRVVHLLDITSGESAVGPGFIDFVPSPDGTIFVTPAPGKNGLEFYDAATVLFQARAGSGADAQPVYTDPEMRDQYPSVGVLQEGVHDTSVITYRVLTSWFENVVFSDYQITLTEQRTVLSVKRSRRLEACPGIALSLPIISPNGTEVAGRDELTGTTKIFQLADNGSCTEVLDLQVATGKVGWNAAADKIAFAIPKGAVPLASRSDTVRMEHSQFAGVFVYERDTNTMIRVQGSEDVNRLAFPEWVGRDSIMFLISKRSVARPDHFRIVCCIQ